MSNAVPVLVTITDILSGVHSWTRRLRRAFAQEPGFDLRLIACNTSRSESPGFDDYVNSRAQLRRLIREAGECVVLSNYIWETLELLAEVNHEGGAARAIGYCHSDSDHEYYAPLEWYEPILSHFVAVSPTCARKLTERIPPERHDQLTMLPYGVEVPEQIAPRTRGGPLRLLYAGRIAQEQKRIRDFLPLARTMVDRGIDFRLTLAGRGPEKRELQEAFRGPLEKRVRFLPPVHPDQMLQLYQEHDILVLVSEFEGTSNAVLEAMAQGVVPVLTRTESGIEGVIRDGESGMVVRIGDMETMARIIEDLAVDRAKLFRLSAGAHADAGRFSIDIDREVLSGLFRRMLKRPPIVLEDPSKLRPETPFAGERLGAKPRWRRELRRLRQRLQREEE